MNKKNQKLHMMITASLMAALAFVMTMFVKIPLPLGGYVHLGDAVVLLCGWLLGPVYGAAAAGIGSMLADLFSGYPQYAVFTLVIKALMAMTVHASSQVFAQIGVKSPLAGRIIGGILAELIMAFGYFACDWVFYGAAATFNLLMYLLKGGVNLAVAVVFVSVLQKTTQRIGKH